jgi:CMP-N-acetylneuraminic acid synthetase
VNVAIITARGNNTLKDKNIFKINGRESLAHVIDMAKASKEIDKIYVSTDCTKIAQIAKREKVEIQFRPDSIAGDVNHEIVIRHAVKFVQNVYGEKLRNITVLLGNCVMTSPQLIDLSHQILRAKPEFDSVMSVWQAGDDHPYRAMNIDQEGSLSNFMGLKDISTTRQSYPPVYYYDQGVWTFRVRCMEKKGKISPWFWMGDRCFPIIRNWITGRDFHTHFDIEVSEWFVKEKKKDRISNIEQINDIIGESL